MTRFSRNENRLRRVFYENIVTLPNNYRKIFSRHLCGGVSVCLSFGWFGTGDKSTDDRRGGGKQQFRPNRRAAIGKADQAT